MKNFFFFFVYFFEIFVFANFFFFFFFFLPVTPLPYPLIKDKRAMLKLVATELCLKLVVRRVPADVWTGVRSVVLQALLAIPNLNNRCMFSVQPDVPIP